jgi:hypothetical protein
MINSLKNFNEAKKSTVKKLVISIDLGNDAFEEDFEGEVSKILKKAIGMVSKGKMSKKLSDTNGNSVGTIEVK